MSSPRGAWVLGIPLSALLVLIVAAVGWMIAVRRGGTATGELARLTFQSECSTAAESVIRERLLAYGLDATVEDTLVFSIRMPGLPDDLDHVPAALARPGHLEIAVAGVPVPVRVVNAGVQISMTGTPVTLLTLDRAVPDGIVAVTMDGEAVDMEAVNGAELQLRASGEDVTRSLRTASDRAVALRLPLPCAVTVVEARSVP